MKTPEIRVMWLILLISQLSFFGLSQNKLDSSNKQITPNLEKSVPVERELKSGEVHSFVITANAGQFAKIVVEQRGIDVAVVLLTPNGKRVAETDIHNDRYGLEELSFVADKSGKYQIQIRASGKNAAGRYEIENEELHVATPQELKQEKIRSLAEKFTDRGLWLATPPRSFFSITILPNSDSDNAIPTSADLREKLLKKNRDLVTPELVRELNKYVRLLCSQGNLGRAVQISYFALELAQKLDDKTGIADVFHNIGYIYYLRNGNTKDFGLIFNGSSWLESTRTDYTEALANLRKSLMLRETPRDNRKMADSFNLMATICREQKDFPPALEYFEKSLALYREPDDNYKTVAALVNIAEIHFLRGSHAQAREAYQKSLRFQELTGDKELLAASLFRLGTIAFVQGEFAQALEHYQKSLQLNKEPENLGITAATLNRISNCYIQSGDYPRALESIEQSAKITATLNDKELTADTYLSRGLVYDALGDNARALEFYQKSFTVSEESRNSALIANALIKIGKSHFLQGDITRASEHYRKSLDLTEVQKNKRLIIFATTGLGEVYRHQGDYSQAWEYFKKSLKVAEEIGNKPLIAEALNSLGSIYAELGNYDEAFEHFQKALHMREETNHSPGIIESANNIGEIYLLRGKYATALEYYQKSLTLSEKIKSKSGMRDALKNIGEVYILGGNYPLALDYSQRSLLLTEELESKLSVPEILNNIAAIHFNQGNYPQALEHSERAIKIARQTESRYLLWKALVTSGKARSALKQFSESRRAFEEAIQTIELSRANVGGHLMRASYFATVQEPYELYVDLLMRLHRQNPNEGYQVQALQISERARARSLLELLNEARTDIRQGVDAELVFRGSLLQMQLNARAEQQTRLLSGNYTPEQYASLKNEIQTLTADFQNNEAQIRQQSPRYAALTQPSPLGLSEIQEEILDGETILLQYALGEARSYLWTVTRDSIKSYELPSRAEIEGAVKKAYGLLSDPDLVFDDKAQTEYETEAARVSRMLLAPVAAQLQNKRLLIVADGALQYLPFGALPNTSQKNARQPLIVENEIIRLPSVSALAVLRRQVKGRQPAPKTVAVIADPVFSADDPRVQASAARPQQDEALTASKQNVILRSAVRQTGILRQDVIQRLPFSRQEAQSILDAVPTDEKVQILDFEASHSRILSQEISQYRIIHFATHGLLNSENPELSGIVLSLVNDEGKPIDGFLRLNEIYNMNLSADLVVLSACQTALGKEIRGEGLIGLTRGFMYAGAPRVVASLWKVDDRATAALMNLFYQKMFAEKMRPAAALRAAKIEMWKQTRWSAPFFWAGFELQGEWR